MYVFLMIDDEFLEKYNEIWEKIINITKKLNSELIYIKNI